jgi:tRNA A37 threonylcarbamoyltransferase TsaD
VGGGVSANAEIRTHLEEMVAKQFPEGKIFLPGHELTGDNAVMIGAAAYLRHEAGKESPKELGALGSLILE